MNQQTEALSSRACPLANQISTCKQRSLHFVLWDTAVIWPYNEWYWMESCPHPVGDAEGMHAVKTQTVEELGLHQLHERVSQSCVHTG